MNVWKDKPVICNTEPGTMYGFKFGNEPDQTHLEYSVGDKTTVLLSQRGVDMMRRDPVVLDSVFADAVDISRGKQTPRDLVDFHQFETDGVESMYVGDMVDIGIWHSPNGPSRTLGHYIFGGHLGAIGMIHGRVASEIVFTPITDEHAARLVQRLHNHTFDRQQLGRIASNLQPIHQRRASKR